MFEESFPVETTEELKRSLHVLERKLDECRATRARLEAAPASTGTTELVRLNRQLEGSLLRSLTIAVDKLEQARARHG